ncbi:MAG: hypothetical protein GQ544_01935 [Candidatus Aminicenantes bacterium]|nr:hypothetical protein [Candidatus Aminicenantes bacterium]
MDPSRPESSSSTKKWLIGCGIGCGVVIVIVALLVTGGVLYVRSLVKGFEDSEAMLKSLTEQHGRVNEFCPDPEGGIGPDRLEAFLQAREATLSFREKIENTIDTLSEGKLKGEVDEKSAGSVLNKLRLGFGMIPQIAEFYKVRTQALLDANMGLGEYYYIYSIAYYSWMGKPISEGPSLQFREGEEFRFEDWDNEEAQQLQEDMLRRRLNRMLLSMLRNQYEKLTSDEYTQASEEWKEQLAAEIEALESDSHQLAWEKGVPDIIASSLEPFRARLESSYSSFLTAIELSIEQK